MTQKIKGSPKRNQIILGGVVIVAVVVAVAFVLLSSQSSFSELSFDYSQIPQGRTDDGGFIIGDADAPLTIVAFEDFLCGHCQSYKTTTEKLISEYVAKGMARFEYRFVPVVDPAYSRLTATLAECADTLQPGSFWIAHDRLFEIASARRFNDSSARTFAEMMDMSYSELLQCTRDASQVDIDTQLANQLGVTGTPTVFIRYGDGYPQLSPFGNQPTFEQLGQLVEQFN